MDEISIENIYNQAIELLLLYGPKFILAIVVLIVGWWLSVVSQIWPKNQ